MADELKRVGLVFTQEGAVDFKKTLQEINLELNKNYNEFKLTQAQWDNSTKSTEKLRAEQEYLKNAYEIQSDKVSTLKMQLSDLENAENKNTTAIKKKRNELTSAEIKLESYNKRLKEIESQLTNTGKKIEEVGEKIENFGGNVEKAGKKVSAFSTATAAALVTCAKSAIDFEDAFAGVEKTVDGTEEQMAELEQGIRDMAKEIPSSTTEISAVAEAAGQLGIATEDILSFTKVMIDLGNSTNLSADEAASALAKFANVTKMSADDYDKLGSTIVELGNNFATTEADIVSMAGNLASSATQVGMSQSDIMALATALSSVGLEAQAGGTAFSKALQKMQLAVETNSDELKDWADVAGMSVNEFSKLFKEDATSALQAFIQGLSECGGETDSAIKVLDEMGITETRMRDALLRSANASDIFTKAIEMGSDAWEDNTALTEEASKRYNTLKSQIQTAINKLKDVAITLGNKLMPSIQKIIDVSGKWVDKFNELSDEEVDMIVKIGLIVTAIGPLITIFGKVTSTIGGVTQGIGTVVQAFGVMNGTVTSTSSVVNKLASMLPLLTNPMTLLTAAIAAGTVAIIAYHTAQIEEMAALDGVRDSLQNQKTTWEELQETREEALNTSSNEIIITQQLADELSKIVDENGKIKEGYETRANYIVSELNSALGTEYSINGDIISQYDTMQTKIQELILAKKAEALLSAYQNEYAEAMKAQSEATANLVSLKQQLKEKTIELHAASGLEREELKANISQIAISIGEEQDLISQYGYTIQNYEALQTASVSGSATAIDEAVTQMGVSWEKAKQNCEESLNSQIQTQSQYVETLREALQEAKKENDEYQVSILQKQLETEEQQLINLAENLAKQTSTIQELTPEQILAWKSLADSGSAAFFNGLSSLPSDTQTQILKTTGIITNDTTIQNAAENSGVRVAARYNENLTIGETTQEELMNTASVINADTSVEEATGELGVCATDEFKANADGTEWGNDLIDEICTSMTSSKNISKVKSAAAKVAAAIESQLGFSLPEEGPLSDADTYMPDMIDLFAKGIKKNKSKVVDEVNNMAQEMSEVLQTTPNITNMGNKTYNQSNTKASIQMNIYCQKLDENELDNIFNYINKRLGTEY